ncbi:MAG: DUF255 domain-containing protein [Bacteroidales bacterium]|nr:DUF255 domain-containing protein [Bacteroidales bacterium]
MKHTIAIILTVVALAAPAASAQIKWNNIATADTATLGERLVFIDFYTSWCGWCKKMDRETFTDPTVAKIMTRYYYPVKFDAESGLTFSWKGTSYKGNQPVNGRQRPHEFAYAILGQRMGFPSYGIFDSDRNLVNVLPGYYSAKDFTILLWYFASGDYKKYAYERYQQIFDSEIRPEMEKLLK